jgi:signal transduction histidine kinase
LELQRTTLQQVADERYEALRELKEARDQMVRQTKLATIGQLKGSIAHEVRNPLGAIHNAAYLLRRLVGRGETNAHSGEIESAKVQKYLDIIDEETEAASHVIKDMLEMVRENTPATSSFDLAKLIRDEFGRSARANRMSFELVCQTEPFTVDADEGQIHQLVSNLLVNSVQATNAEGQIVVTLDHDGDSVLILVRDDGPGIRDEDLDRLFEPLFTTKAKGTGLGLAICRQIVERHGGEIELDAPNDSGGTVFRVKLPQDRTTTDN